jgi:hypothetical protein
VNDPDRGEAIARSIKGAHERASALADLACLSVNQAKA